MALDPGEQLLLVEALSLLWGEGRRRLKALPADDPAVDRYRQEVAEVVAEVEKLREKVALGRV